MKPAREQQIQWWWNVEPTLFQHRPLFHPHCASVIIIDHHAIVDLSFMKKEPGGHWDFGLAGSHCRSALSPMLQTLRYRQKVWHYENNCLLPFLHAVGDKGFISILEDRAVFCAFPNNAILCPKVDEVDWQLEAFSPVSLSPSFWCLLAWCQPQGNWWIIIIILLVFIITTIGISAIYALNFILPRDTSNPI